MSSALRTTAAERGSEDASSSVSASHGLASEESRNRNTTMWAQALVLFNVVGIPLSYGTYLEFYFNSTHTNKSLTSLSIPVALQILCILSMPFAAGYVYHRLGDKWWWRLIFVASSCAALSAQVALQWLHAYLFILVFQGFVLGVALGVLFTISTLVLASHYKNNIPLVSMQSGFASFLGAVIYSILARQSFRTQYSGRSGFAQAASAGLLGGTLLCACILMKRVKEDQTKPESIQHRLKIRWPQGLMQDLAREGAAWFILGYMLVFFGIFIYPIYIVLVLASTPTLGFPDSCTTTLLVCLGIAALSACVVGNDCACTRVGPVNMLVTASIFGGAVLLAPVRLQLLAITTTLGAMYGLALGSFLALHIMVAAVFLSPNKMWAEDMPARVAIVMVLGGLSAFAGIVSLAVVMEAYEHGVDIALRIAGASVVVGGAMVGAVRMKKWRRLGYVV
ncbi:hypothetical protein ACN47E_000167 [Coniothyrium glycines]